jgi:hypothetical protein
MAFSSESFLRFHTADSGMTCGRVAVGATGSGPHRLLPGARDDHTFFRRRQIPSRQLARIEQVFLHCTGISAQGTLKECW